MGKELISLNMIRSVVEKEWNGSFTSLLISLRPYSGIVPFVNDQSSTFPLLILSTSKLDFLFPYVHKIYIYIFPPLLILPVLSTSPSLPLPSDQTLLYKTPISIIHIWLSFSRRKLILLHPLTSFFFFLEFDKQQVFFFNKNHAILCKILARQVYVHTI